MTKKPTPRIKLHWIWIPPLTVLALSISLRVALRGRYELLSVHGQTAVDLLVILSPVIGFFVPVLMLERRRRQEQAQQRHENAA
jgi:hypothetical protein